MITPKFWAIVRREGFLKTWTRGHKAGRHSHYIGSNNPAGYVKPVGEDEFGNRYYEDFDVSRKIHKQIWIEKSNAIFFSKSNKKKCQK